MPPTGTRSTGASARALLITVVGEYYREPGRQVWGSTLIAALGALGVGESATRKALSRSIRAGWLRATRNGRRIRCELTPAARGHLGPGTTGGRTGWLLVAEAAARPAD